MAEAMKFEARKRTEQGKQAVRRLRKQGLIPAVLYGHKEETVSLALPTRELEKAIRQGIHVLDIRTEGNVQKALIREVQWDHLGVELLHVDFARVAADERIVVSIPIEIRGTAPGIATGGVLDQPIHTLAVECLAISVPESIRVNVGELQLGSAIHVRELILPEGVKAMADPDAIVVHVTQKQLEEAATVAPIAAEQAEPEIIGRKVVEEEEAE